MSKTTTKNVSKKTSKPAAKKSKPTAAKKAPIQRFPFNCKLSGLFHVETRDGADAAKTFAKEWLLEQLTNMTAKEYGDEFKLVSLSGPGKPVDRTTK